MWREKDAWWWLLGRMQLSSNSASAQAVCRVQSICMCVFSEKKTKKNSALAVVH